MSDFQDQRILELRSRAIAMRNRLLEILQRYDEKRPLNTPAGTASIEIGRQFFALTDAILEPAFEDLMKSGASFHPILEYFLAQFDIVEPQIDALEKQVDGLRPGQ